MVGRRVNLAQGETMKKYLILLSLGFLSLGTVGAQVIIKNPNPYTPGADVKPRSAAVVAAEKKMAQEAVKAIDAYAKANGIDKAIVEVNKGRSGAFAKSIPATPVYLAITKMKGTTAGSIVGHIIPAFVGFEIPDLSAFKDNTNWAYDTELFTKGGKGSFEGTIEGVLWSDPEWQKGKKCLMIAYNKVQAYKNTAGQTDNYWTYFAIWLEE